MSRFLILGTGSAQRDYVELLKQQGHYVVGFSYRHEGEALPLLDQFEQINIIDKEAVYQYALAHQIDVVYSVGSDLAMPTVGYVNDRMHNGCFVTEQIASLMQDKSLFRTFLRQHSIPSISFRIINTEADLTGWGIYPAIVKPVDSQGQRGVGRANDSNELRKLYREALTYSRTKTVIAEQYIDGEEISVNGFLYKGKLIYCFISDRRVVEGFTGGLVKGHNFPTKASQEEQRQAAQLVSQVAQAIGLADGPIYFQMKRQGGKVYIIEGTPRFDGCHIWRLIHQRYGINLLHMTTELLLTGSLQTIPAVVEPKKRADILDFYIQSPYTPFDETQCPIHPQALYRQLSYADGEQIRPINGKAEKVGYQLIQLTI